jgi:hypothetical protein
MSHATSSKSKRRRGRPPKVRRPVRKLTHPVAEFCRRTNTSRATAFRWMRDGLLKFGQAAPGHPRQIPVTEYSRLGFGEIIDEVEV